MTETERKLRAIIQGVIDSDEADNNIRMWAAEQLAALDGKCTGPGGPWCETMTKREKLLRNNPKRLALVKNQPLRGVQTSMDMWDLAIVFGAAICPCCHVRVNRPALSRE